MRRVTPSLRGALAASLVLHLGLGVLLLVLAPRAVPKQHSDARLDTRVEEPAIRFFERVVPAVEVVVPFETPTPEAAQPRPEDVPPQPPLARAPALPSAVPPELLAVIKRPGPVGDPVVEVPIQPLTGVPSAYAVQPAGLTTAVAMHGAMPAGQSIVYVLDVSGSMGESNKLTLARHALLATLRMQPDSVRVQVVVYSSTASRLLPENRCVFCNPRTLATVERGLAEREPAGRSDHAAGLQAALELKPDFVVIVTDADHLSRSQFRAALQRHHHPATICIARVTSSGVTPPQELK